MKNITKMEMLEPEVMPVVPAEVELFRRSLYGNKTEMLAPIASLIPAATMTVADLFSGSGVVAWFLKKRGHRVICNDVMRYPALTLRATVGNNRTMLTEGDLRSLGQPNRSRGDHAQRFYHETFGPENCLYLDNYAANVSNLTCPMKRDVAAFIPIACIAKPLSKYAAIHWTALGTLTGYRHLWYFDLEKEVRNYALNVFPKFLIDNGEKNEVFNEDAVELVGRISADVAYIDVPYVCRAGAYEGNYGLLDDLTSILLGDGNCVKDPYDSRCELAPYTYFHNRRSALTGFSQLFERSRHIPHVIVSYNTTSLITPSEIVTIAEVYRNVVGVHSVSRPLPVSMKGRCNKTEEVLIVLN